MNKILMVSACALALTACSQVHPGHVGIKVSQFGSGAGVSDVALGVGSYFTPFGTTIEEYPVFTSTYTWSRSETEGKAGAGNEEFSFQDKSGLSVAADVSVAYHVDPTKAPILYQKYRQDMDGILAGPVRNVIRNAIQTESAKLGVEEIYGAGKAQLSAAALADAQKYFEPYGLHIEQVNWASTIRLPAAVLAQINAKIANEQAALAAQANVATAEADARAKIAEAKGKADSMALEAAALRSNPEMAQLRAIEKWDGSLPTTMTGGAVPFLAVGSK